MGGGFSTPWIKSLFREKLSQVGQLVWELVFQLPGLKVYSGKNSPRSASVGGDLSTPWIKSLFRENFPRSASMGGGFSTPWIKSLFREKLSQVS